MGYHRVLENIARVESIISGLEEQKAKTQTPIIVKNCDRSLEIFSVMLIKLKQRANGYAIDRNQVQQANGNFGTYEN